MSVSVVSYVQAPAFEDPDQVPDYYSIFTFSNHTNEPLWAAFTTFRFPGRVNCNLHSIEEDLSPGEVRHRRFRLLTGRCSNLDSKLQTLANETGTLQALPYVQPEDLYIPYSFNICFWPADPATDPRSDPVKKFGMEGLLMVPRGTLSNYCVHHTVDSADPLLEE